MEPLTSERTSCNLSWQKYGLKSPMFRFRFRKGKDSVKHPERSLRTNDVEVNLSFPFPLHIGSILILNSSFNSYTFNIPRREKRGGDRKKRGGQKKREDDGGIRMQDVLARNLGELYI